MLWVILSNMLFIGVFCKSFKISVSSGISRMSLESHLQQPPCTPKKQSLTKEKKMPLSFPPPQKKKIYIYIIYIYLKRPFPSNLWDESRKPGSGRVIYRHPGFLVENRVLWLQPFFQQLFSTRDGQTDHWSAA